MVKEVPGGNRRKVARRGGVRSRSSGRLAVWPKSLSLMADLPKVSEESGLGTPKRGIRLLRQAALDSLATTREHY